MPAEAGIHALPPVHILDMDPGLRRDDIEKEDPSAALGMTSDERRGAPNQP
ncbi:MAG: hypothetical protein SFX19_10465 [Alphaproteobacteria bacterium]|nr:hypothetical protein [Alphaproteobacteria bacterium]